MTKKIEVELKGITPLLMHRYPLEPVEGFNKMTREEQAEIGAYRDSKTKELFIPGGNIQRALVAGATYVKGKGRASLQKQTAACLFIEPERVYLGTNEYTVDSRRAVNPTTKGAIIANRPRLDRWSCKFFISYDEVLLSEKNIRDIVENTVSKVGFLSFRPEKKGPYGRSMIVKWDTVTD